MNINRYNYRRALPVVVQSLREADFIAFDFEFSGLQCDDETLSNHQSDTIELRYWKYRENIRQFTPLQLGICGFKYSQESRSLECFPFNFYILPASPKTFLSQVASLHFLADNNFDFNKLIYESCSYVSIDEYSKQKQQTASKPSFTEYKDPECIIYCNSQFTAIKEWLDEARAKLSEGNQVKLLDISYCRQKLFASLQANLSQMFPDDLLESKVISNGLNPELLMEIKLTTKARQQKQLQDELSF